MKPRHWKLAAAAGALLTLFLHPVSRPYLMAVFWHPAAIDSAKPLIGEMPEDFATKHPATMQDAIKGAAKLAHCDS